MNIGDVVVHKESTSGYAHDGDYMYMYDCRMKNPTDGSWIDGIVYVNKTGDLFVRSKDDFLNKFKKHEGEI